MNWLEFSEEVIVLRIENSEAVASAIRAAAFDGIIDVIQTETEIAIHYDGKINPEGLIKRISMLDIPSATKKEELFEVPVCYDLGQDLEEVMVALDLEKSKFIEQHSSIEYKVQFGFAPGFLYLSGLPNHLQCRRKEIPRTRVQAGSVGIGGNKTGVYGLESPGGWQIIGRTPLKLFDINEIPANSIPSGSMLKFVPITKTEFEKLNENS